MEFKNFRDRLREHFDTMMKQGDLLYDVDVDRDELWNLYLDSFPAQLNRIYVTRRYYDCSSCRHFIKSFGNVVIIKDNQVVTLWDFDAGEFQPVVDALADYVRSKPIIDVHYSDRTSVGVDHNTAMITIDGVETVKTWNHFRVQLPRKWVNAHGRSEGEFKNGQRTTKQVFKRSLDEINPEAVEEVLELIAQNSIYRGEEWKSALGQFQQLQATYRQIPDDLKDNWAWDNFHRAGVAVTKIRNHSMGTLLVDLSEGVDLDTAVKKYEAIVAPENYKRPKAIYTQRMLQEAKETVTNLGYLGSLERRFAKLDDITVNNILFSNKDAARRIIGGESVFDRMEQAAVVNPKKFSKVQEIPIDDFIKDVLPTATSVDVLLESRHASNLMSLIAPVNREAPSMFKWNNPFSWAYSGNITDSSMKERVKAAGGKVDGVLRFSIQWNDLEEWDKNDLDAHCQTPTHHIFFGEKLDFYTRGTLDIDIINPENGRVAVENITWPSLENMVPGRYDFFVNCYTNRGGTGGFRAEIEFNGEIYSYDYNRPLRQGENVLVATVTYDGHGGFTISEKLKSGVSSRKLWSVDTNQFVPATVICYSPNYWDEQSGIGNRHYCFFLKDCVNPDKPNGFYNEFLKPELEKHKRVFEALGSQMAVQDTPDQLSGLGFSSTKHNDLLVKVSGATERTLRIRF